MSEVVVPQPECKEWRPIDPFHEPVICKNCRQGFDSHLNPFNKPDQCLDCTLYREPGIVWGVGPENADMFFLGEGPGADEVDFPYFRHYTNTFKPFIGKSGRMFTSLLANADIDRNTVFIDNVVKCRPPGNRSPSDWEMQKCAPFLIEALEKQKPNVIVAMGDPALRVLTDKKGIGLYRGVATEGPLRGDGTERYKVFPTWHPAFIARMQHNWPFAVHDLARAKTQGTFQEIRRVPFEIVRDASATRDGADILSSARARGAATFDFETTGLSPERDSIVYLGVVSRTDKAHVLTWSDHTQQLFQALLDDPAIEIVGQNILYFDLPFYAAKKGARVTFDRIFDTMVAFHLCNSTYGQTPIAEQNAGTFQARGAEKDLSMIASCHTDMEYWKSRDHYKRDLLGVCGLDVIATDRSALNPVDGLKAELKSYDMVDLYYKHVLPVHPILFDMTKRGIRVDMNAAVGWGKVLDEEADFLEATLLEGLGDLNLNLNSPQQLMELLYVKMGLPPQYTMDKKKGKRLTANAEAVETLAVQFPQHAVVGLIKDHRHLKKMKSTYVEPALFGDGYLHPKFGVSKAATGRFNSWDPNAQNVPEQMRDIWVADDDDCILLSGDWSQIEWRLAMVMSGDPVGLELLASGVDNHSAVAAETLGKRIGPNPNGTCDAEESSEFITEAERYRSKFIVYGLGYGRGADSICKAEGFPYSFVDSFITRFFKRFQVFKQWRDRNVDFVKRNHHLANPFKRRRWWYTWAITEVYNFPQQSTAADMMYDALIALANALHKQATLRLTVHDEVVLNVPKDLVKETWNCVRDTMQSIWPQIVEASANPALVKKFYPNGWYCPVDLHVGTNWAMCKSKKPDMKTARAALEKHLGLGGH